MIIMLKRLMVISNPCATLVEVLSRAKGSTVFGDGNDEILFRNIQFHILRLHTLYYRKITKAKAATVGDEGHVRMDAQQAREVRTKL